LDFVSFEKSIKNLPEFWSGRFLLVQNTDFQINIQDFVVLQALD
jgi:hypothetical protein